MLLRRASLINALQRHSVAVVATPGPQLDCLTEGSLPVTNWMRFKMNAKTVVSTAIFVCAISTAGGFVGSATATDKYVVGEPAIQQWFPTVREEADGLPGHTVYRPADMTRFAPNSVPVIV